VFARDESGYAMAICPASISVLRGLTRVRHPLVGHRAALRKCALRLHLAGEGAPTRSSALLTAQGWRWLYWVNLIVGGGMLPILYFTMPETRDSIILLKRVKRLRRETGNDTLRAPKEDSRHVKGHFFKVTIVRAVKFLFTEPVRSREPRELNSCQIVYLSATWNGFLFGVILCAGAAMN